MKQPGTTPKTEGAEGPESAHADLGQHVLAALRADSDIDASGIEVEVKKVSGAVTLLGSIPTLAQHHKAGELVASIEGVSIVHNHLRVIEEEDPTETHPPPRRKPQA